MNISRRNFIGGLSSLGATMAFTGTGCFSPAPVVKKPEIALQLYSIGGFTKKFGLEKTLEEVAKMGYKAVEFAGYHNFTAKQIKKMLDDNGLKACGTHLVRDMFSPEKIEATLDFEQEYGNNYVCCPGGGNVPPNCSWKGTGVPNKDWMDMICAYYNTAAETAAKRGCYIALHNHMWEHQLKMADGTSYWDYFFSNTSKIVQMEQDVGWTTCAGVDPCEQFKKYPGRSRNIHAKENGMGKEVKKFDAILGQPGEGAVPVNWDAVIAEAINQGSEYLVVECERHQSSLFAVKPSIEFLKSKGL